MAQAKLFKRSKGAKVAATPAKPAAERKPKTENTDDYDPMIDSYSPEKS